MFATVKKYLLLSVGALLLAAALPSVSLLTRAEVALSRSTPAADVLDLSAPLSESAVEMNAREFLSLLLADDESLSQIEADYLGGLSDRPLKYTALIPSSCVQADHSGGTLTVTATPYTYTTVSGVSVTWTPDETAAVGNTPLTLSLSGDNGTRIGALDIADTDGLRLTVPYSCALTIPASIANRYRNLAWTYADELFSEQTDYETRLAAYNAYQDYLAAMVEYNAAYAKWQDYTVKKAKYDNDIQKYTAYEAAMVAYRAAEEAFAAYENAKAEYDRQKTAFDAAEDAYIAEKNIYDADKDRYDRDMAEIDRAAAALTVLDSVFAPTQGPTLYGTLMGDTVAMVVSRKDELVTVGKCDPVDIDEADRATRVLKTLLTEYKALEGVPARFAYYKEHYTEIKENFICLYGRLYSLYKNSNVKTTLINRGKLERYMEFVSQLYVVSTGLDDTVNRSSDWEIAGRYDPLWFDYTYYGYEELLPLAEHRPPDNNNADPTDLSCPSAVPSAPTEPTFTLTRPIEPETVPRPVEPETVNKPTEPTFVSKPTRPKTVEDPGDKPLAPAYTSLQQQLISARRDNILQKRSVIGDKEISLSTSLQKNLRPCHVDFYDVDGQTLLFSADPNVGDSIVYEGPTPSRADTPKYTYTFIGWRDETGQLVENENFGVASENGNRFYASYTEAIRFYTVTWSVEGTETSVSLPYGTAPVYEGDLEKAPTAQYTYRFVGWRANGADDYSLRLDNVTENVTYEAVYESILQRYTVTWVFDEGKSESAQWDYGAVPSPSTVPEKPSDAYIYTFSEWNTSPVAVTEDVTYTARYTAIPVLPPTAPDTAPQTPTLSDDIYTAVLGSAPQQIDRLLALALRGDCTIDLVSSDGVINITFNQAALTDFLEVGGTHISLSAIDGGYALRMTDTAGKPVSLQAPITLRLTAATAHTAVYIKASDTLTPLAFAYEDGEISVRLREGGDLIFRNEYGISVLPAENGKLSADRSFAMSGDLIQLNISVTSAFRLRDIHIIGTTSGTAYPLGQGFTFVMPDEPVTVSAVFARKTHTVSFVVDGQIVSMETYQNGDSLILPDDPTKGSVGKRVYTFIGWSPVVTPTVSADVTYVAQFRESIQSNNATYIPPGSRNRAYLLYIEVGVLLAILIATPIVTVCLIKRRRRKKKGKTPS